MAHNSRGTSRGMPVWLSGLGASRLTNPLSSYTAVQRQASFCCQQICMITRMLQYACCSGKSLSACARQLYHGQPSQWESMLVICRRQCRAQFSVGPNVCQLVSGRSIVVATAVLASLLYNSALCCRRQSVTITPIPDVLLISEEFLLNSCRRRIFPSTKTTLCQFEVA